MQYVDTNLGETRRANKDIEMLGVGGLNFHPSSFLSRMPNECREVERIRRFIESVDSRSIEAVEWFVNEDNTEELANMAFPTWFPTGDVDWLHPCICNVEMHEYGFHLLRYCDQRFGSHPRFRYFLLNMIMHRCSQGTTSFFLKNNIHETTLATIQELH